MVWAAAQLEPKPNNHLTDGKFHGSLGAQLRSRSVFSCRAWAGLGLADGHAGLA
jgi:hypothetical protein